MPEHVSLLEENGWTAIQTARKEGGGGKRTANGWGGPAGVRGQEGTQGTNWPLCAYSLSASSLQLGLEAERQGGSWLYFFYVLRFQANEKASEIRTFFPFPGTLFPSAKGNAEGSTSLIHACMHFFFPFSFSFLSSSSSSSVIIISIC